MLSVEEQKAILVLHYWPIGIWKTLPFALLLVRMLQPYLSTSELTKKINLGGPISQREEDLLK